MTLEEKVDFLEENGIDKCKICKYEKQCEQSLAIPMCFEYDLEKWVDIDLIFEKTKELEEKKEKEMNNFYNASGVKDPTAGKAIKQVTREERETDKLAKEKIKLVKEIINKFDFAINKLELIDKKTGKEYKNDEKNKTK